MTKVMDWPTFNSLVWLRLPCCASEHPTRVEDFVDELVVVGAPSSPHLKPVEPVEGDDAFFLGWLGPSGAVEVPVVLRQHDSQPIPTWTLRQVGDPIETQRRSYVRIPINLEVKVSFTLTGPPEIVVTDDLSEGGLRFHVNKWVKSPGPDAFDVELTLKDRTFHLKGQVAWWGELDKDDKRSVGVRFLNIEPTQADAIRGFVFAAEVERRRKFR